MYNNFRFKFSVCARMHTHMCLLCIYSQHFQLFCNFPFCNKADWSLGVSLDQGTKILHAIWSKKIETRNISLIFYHSGISLLLLRLGNSVLCRYLLISLHMIITTKFQGWQSLCLLFVKAYAFHIFLIH